MEGIKTKADFYIFNFFLVCLFIFFGSATHYAES